MQTPERAPRAASPRTDPGGPGAGLPPLALALALVLALPSPSSTFTPAVWLAPWACPPPTVEVATS